MTRILPLGALTKGLDGEQLSELHTLHQAGCVGFSNARRPITNTLVLRRAMEYAATHGLTLFIQPQDHWLSENGCAHEGAISTRLGLPGIPESAETVELARCLALVEQTGVRVHFGQITTARAVEMLADAQQRGLPVSADVAIHHLFLTEMDISNYNSTCHVMPPLRSQRDMQGLRKGVADGTIAAICSDHTPLDHDAKQAPFCETAPGISGLETLLPLANRLLEEGVLSLEQLVDRLSYGPARVLGIDVGEIRSGTSADLIVFDPDAEWVLEQGELASRGQNSPFVHWQFKGRVSHTLMNGQLSYQSE
jgi:dihydroorotase